MMNFQHDNVNYRIAFKHEPTGRHPGTTALLYRFVTADGYSMWDLAIPPVRTKVHKGDKYNKEIGRREAIEKLYWVVYGDGSNRELAGKVKAAYFGRERAGTYKRFMISPTPISLEALY